MKRVSTCCLLVLGMIFNSHSQCTADASCTTAQIVCPSTLALACKNDPYLQVITIAVPASVTVGTATYPIQKIKLNSVTGMPSGFSNTCNPTNCTFNGGTKGCFTISGTPATAGNYPMTANTTITILIGTPPLQFPISLDTAFAVGPLIITDKDCAGVCGGTASFDNCSICSGGSTGVLANCEDGNPCTVDACNAGQCTAHTDTCCQIQNITLAAGWSIISGFVIPDEPALPNVFNEIAGNIILVKNNMGQTYIPALNVNTIGNWDFKQGYKVKTNAASSLILHCTLADPSTPIALNGGWSMIPYLHSYPINISAALSSLGSDIILVKNSAGQSYIPALNINTIGEMVPGQGYQVKLSAPRTLVYPE